MDHLVILLVSAILCNLYEVNGCFCAPNHPQVQFCNSDFAVKIHVKSVKEVSKLFDRTEDDVTVGDDHTIGNEERVTTTSGIKLITTESSTTESPTTESPMTESVVGATAPEPVVAGSEPTSEPVHTDADTSSNNPNLAASDQPQPDLEAGNAGFEPVVTGSEPVMAGSVPVGGESDEPSMEQPELESPDPDRVIDWNPIGSSHRRGEHPIKTGVVVVTSTKATRPSSEASIIVDDFSSPDTNEAAEHIASDAAESDNTLLAVAGQSSAAAVDSDDDVISTVETARHHRKRSAKRKHKKHHKSKVRAHGLEAKRNVLLEKPIFPGDNPPGAAMDLRRHRPQPLATRYRVRILKVFKGNVTEGLDYIYTAPSSALCKRHLETKKTYIIIGNWWPGTSRMRINLCGYLADVADMTVLETQNLIRNMKDRYPRNCGTCGIHVCRGTCRDDEKPSTDRCVWNNMYTLLPPSVHRASQFACVRKKNQSDNECHWYNAIAPEQSPDDIPL